MFLKGKVLYVFFAAVFAILHYMSLAEAAPQPSQEFYSPQLSFERNNNPEYLLQTLARLRQALIAEEDLENTKRGLDLGLSRGYSGSQAAKHLMGLAAANFAGGPGRRRRSDNDD